MALAGTTLLGVFFASQTMIGAMYAGRPLSWSQAILLTLTAWYVRLAFAPIVIWLTHRFDFAPGRIGRSSAVHGISSLLLGIAQQMLRDLLLRSFTTIPRAAAPPVELHMNVLVYWVIVVGTLGFGYYARLRERELAAVQLQHELADARLDLLRSQLQPHFLFNTLNGISELMHEDVERADHMLTNLSDLLRLSLAQGEARDSTLAAELDFVRRYLEIQQMRFPDRLRVDYRIAPAAMAVRVPFLLLQPLVENAVRHGIAPRSSPGRLEISAQLNGGRLLLEIRDDGPGPPADHAEGVGLRNTRARLLHTYGDQHRFGFGRAPGGGCLVTIEIPAATTGVQA